jgi:predicted nucleic acid-binding Zn ribbon protein
MKRLSDILPGALGRAQVLRTARAQIAMRHWESVVGELLAKHTTPDRYDKGTLWVCASGSAWAQELRLHKDEIIRRLNECAASEQLFCDLRVGVRQSRRARDAV